MNSTKQHVCPVDGRRFATKAALADHRRQLHMVGTPVQAGVPRARARGGRGRGRARRGTPSLGLVPAPLSVPVNESSNNRTYGEDRVLGVVAHQVGLMIERISIQSDMSPRLRNLSHAYQKMRWERCEMTVSPQAPLTTSGGYVAGFVMDPEDRSVTIEQLAASQGAVTKKWYETATLNMPASRVEYFTQFGTDLRLSSPASFWIIGDGNPSQDVTVVVTVRWTVVFSKAAVTDSYSFVSRYDLTSVKSNYNLQIRVAGQWVNDVTPLLPPDVPRTTTYVFYRVPTFVIEYSEGAGDTGTKQMHFVAYRPSDRRMYYSQNGKTIDQTAWQSDLDYQNVVPCGTYYRYAGTGNPGCLQRRQLSPLRASPASLDLSPEQILFLENLLESLGRGRRASTPSSQSYDLVRHQDPGPSS